MSENIIKIPQGNHIEGREFYANNLDEALKNCQDAGLEAVFMPALVDVRISASKGDRVWNYWYSTPSLRATGRTKQGNAVVVYAHVPNCFSNPSNITRAKKNLVNGAGVMSKKEFQRLLSLEDSENVFVVDYKTLKNSESRKITLENALSHPQTIPFLGGEERAEKYLERHKEFYRENIGIWHYDDLSDKLVGRLLHLSGSSLDTLGGDTGLDTEGRFVGVYTGKSSKSLKDLVKLKEKLVKSHKDFEEATENFKNFLQDFGKRMRGY